MEDNAAVVESQNKTTHAIRGLLLTLLVYLIGSILSGIAIGIGAVQKITCASNALTDLGAPTNSSEGCITASANGNLALVVGGIIVLVMMAATIFVIGSALKKSKP